MARRQLRAAAVGSGLLVGFVMVRPGPSAIIAPPDPGAADIGGPRSPCSYSYAGAREDLRVVSMVWNEKRGLLRSDRGSMSKLRSQKVLFVLWLLSFPASRKGLPSGCAREGLPTGWPLTWACDGGRDF